jgi:hypothetical protein
MQSARETSMWRDDDFEDKGKRITAVPKDKAVELVNDPDLELKGKAGDLMEEPRDLSH